MTPRLNVLFAVICALVLGWPSALSAVAREGFNGRLPPPASFTNAIEHGALLPSMAPTADPREDFYRYATGGWQDRTAIPADRAAYGIGSQVDDRVIERLLQLLEDLATSNELVVGSDEWKAVQLFAQATDLQTRNAQGIDPIRSDLDEIDAVTSLTALYAMVRESVLKSNNSFTCAFHCLSVDPDLEDSSVYALWYQAPSLGLPNRDYYWEDNEDSETIREAYQTMIAALLGYAGYDESDALDAARRVYAFEKRLAEPLLRPEDFNDPANYYHPHPVSDFIAANPSLGWPAYLAAAGIPHVTTVIVTEEKYFTAVADIIATTELETVKDLIKVRVLLNNASALSEEIGDAAFAFYGTTLRGVEARRPIEERALFVVEGGLGFALGKLYVDRYFPPEAKTQIEALADEVIAAARVRIEALAWMSPETKAAALAKLDSLRVKVGYPDEWRTYEGVTIEESLAQTLLSVNIAEAKRQLARVGKPVDREEWLLLPQTVDAYYDAINNEIVFPAGILQPPFFDYQADPAVNYGGIGAVIGHEITHAFDQEGSRFDADGNLADWWTEADNTRFEELTAAVATQYDAVEVLPGLTVDGDLTIGENIADMGGLQIAHDALGTVLAKDGDPGLIEGLTQEERFFIAYALSWAVNARDEFLRTQVMTDVHAAAHVRAVQPARNMNAFHEAFGIEPGDAMDLPPKERVVIW